MVHEKKVLEIGTYPQMVKAGEQQSMLFTDSCKGSFWLNNMDKFLSRIDVYHEGSQVNDKTKAQLLFDLRCAGVDTTFH